jgi:hypothetical protein
MLRHHATLGGELRRIGRIVEQDLTVFFYKLVSGNRYRSRRLADLKEVPERGPFLAKLVSDRHTEVLSAALDELEAG